MRAMHLLPLLLVPAIAVADPAPRGAELVYGAGVSFMLHAPAGWVLDDTVGADQGVDAVYVPRGSTFVDARTVVFARAVPTGGQTAAKVIDQEIASMREDAPQLAVDPPAAWTCGKKRGRLTTLAHDPAGNAEALVFLDEPGALVVIGLLAKDVDARTKAMPKLREVCRSYHFVGPVTP